MVILSPIKLTIKIEHHYVTEKSFLLLGHSFLHSSMSLKMAFTTEGPGFELSTVQGSHFHVRSVKELIKNLPPCFPLHPEVCGKYLSFATLGTVCACSGGIQEWFSCEGK